MTDSFPITLPVVLEHTHAHAGKIKGIQSSNACARACGHTDKDVIINLQSIAKGRV